MTDEDIKEDQKIEDKIKAEWEGEQIEKDNENQDE